jgi:MoxR-like ATPase
MPEFEFEFELYSDGKTSKNVFEKPLPAPPWRQFPDADGRNLGLQQRRGQTYRPTEKEVQAVNAAIHLRRPLLLTGEPGSGKSSLAYSVAWKLELGEVLYWPINSKTLLEDGLYEYDAIARLRDANLKKRRRPVEKRPDQPLEEPDKAVKERSPQDIEKYLKLGPLGTALAPRNDAKDHRPRILLIDELDKSDIDLPNDLLHVFEEGFFMIPELQRLEHAQPIDIRTAYREQDREGLPPEDRAVPIQDGRVVCRQFPIVVITSNGEREFPRAFSRRCIRHRIERIEEYEPLEEIARSHFELDDAQKQVLDPVKMENVINHFLGKRHNHETLANDQLLSALYLANSFDFDSQADVIELILQNLQ